MIDKRNRFAYAGMAAVVMGLGLLCRKISDVLPDISMQATHCGR
ncbi:hypothetical protein S101359_01280 [Bacillus atrophaeus]|nr:hypothetical protein S101359_01280 [Bacillus atrophaeus]